MWERINERLDNMWTVKQLQEADYGCEERMPGEPLKTLVVLESDDGRVCQFEVADEWLTKQEIEEGDEWPEDIDKVDTLAEQISIQNECMNSYFGSLAQLEEA